MANRPWSLASGERRPSVVQAVYADGTAVVITNQAVLTSLNPEIAAVDSDGFITGLSPGKAEIVAEYAGFSARLPVTVAVTDNPSETPGRFYLDSEDYSLMTGGELDIQALFTDEADQTSIVNGETRFTIADPDIAQVDEHGYLLGLKPGSTSVTAVYREHTFTASVLVVKPYAPVPVPEPTPVPMPAPAEPAALEPEVNDGPEVDEEPAVSKETVVSKEMVVSKDGSE
ncbi:Ig-like domain-containing protein [Paenibacillus macerans]|uniref:Ig-like domain-containing protein n=1 Tax=Paenibacillus macerans TaxID=44252 RepID=UPI001F0E3D67|nr:Ig-like domain-containing protein [Paenibacillus macerans]UMV49648.1 Ig-like domain-containing protein [Paenibacillus macerans]